MSTRKCAVEDTEYLHDEIAKLRKELDRAKVSARVHGDNERRLLDQNDDFRLALAKCRRVLDNLRCSMHPSEVSYEDVVWVLREVENVLEVERGRELQGVSNQN